MYVHPFEHIKEIQIKVKFEYNFLPIVTDFKEPILKVTFKNFFLNRLIESKRLFF